MGFFNNKRRLELLLGRNQGISAVFPTILLANLSTHTCIEFYTGNWGCGEGGGTADPRWDYKLTGEQVFFGGGGVVGGQKVLCRGERAGDKTLDCTAVL